MSHPNAEAQKSSGGLMEDLINIFVNPSAVFEHQRNKSFVMPALIQTILFAALVFGLRNLIMPFWDAETSRQMAAQAAAMAAKGQAMPEGAKAMGEKMASYGSMIGPIIAPWFTAIVGGLFTFLASRLVGAKLSFGQSAMIASWSNFPAVLSFIAMGIIGMMMDPATVRGVTDGQLGPGKFFDPNTTSPALVALFQNLDLFNIWSIVIMGIGIAVVARVPRGSGFVGALIKWGIVVLFSIVPAVLRG